MTKISQESKTFKLLEALKTGKAITPAQARNRWGIQNIRAEASRLRQAGYAVESQRRVAGNYVEVTEYRMAKRPRTMK